MTSAVTITGKSAKTGWNFRKATPADLQEIEKTLVEAGLPLDGVKEQPANFLLAFDQEDKLVGTAALEPYGKDALLRSVAVLGSQRGTGLGQKLVSHLLAQAKQAGFESVALLTTTAENYYPRFGFKPVSREGVPDPVKQSVEFKSACPDTAIAMLLDLTRPPVLVRSATPNDIADITLIYNQGIEDSCTFETEIRSEEERLEWFKNHDERHPVLVAVQLGQVVGWASLNVYNARYGYRFVADLSIYIERAFRGSGIGSALLPALIERARPLGFHKLVLTTFPHTTAGVKLYAKNGFRHVGDYKEQGLLNGVWTDVRVMELILE
jgi:L-amino acid N-acyltransferase YncA